MQFTSFVLAALTSVASAQNVQVVTVSSTNNSLTYSPSNLKAAVGDMVQFQFVAGNHTVTQSTFDQPCQPINTILSNVTGFHSGFMPVAASKATGMIPTYTVQIKSTTPVWIYCAQGRHCQSGMVMVINENTAANSSRSLANFVSLAATQSGSVSPGTGSAGGNSGTGTGADTGAGTGTGTGAGTGAGAGTGTGTGTSTPVTAGSSTVKTGNSIGLAAAAAVAAVLLL